ncbi:MAG TPA: Asp-tRNA(Asn)/Glu-tRNA(Gln) amidotransferase subunit GatC [Defluviitoga tunisiensis]|jgi:aspartyl-tRNA(Asn)/glutamyl-tRNA(Gln) amidotransferase subunit C|nr:Asp-tRNA(Asn)/Glu-tRNA(Gln) amidotransferase subunit GatC [Defluviitoga tunisiensis]HOL86078.1 Asp-tRNA(Asn)/Glu-tRNA(Gln) amidotransferase subunit GatC [Defluviitoga tunisiensis]HPZ66232.1 Asp-tRNA(Asn)/Glu-tRNA(Gln) amidotransferase subunit GatC [Defluviitoga tunisiensis]HQD42962.1 Asp-tRNA(Asn)/Glu-tRNA(Gln) amidotransferase subunit GatC [Defluviitoga tunisiensis]
MEIDEKLLKRLEKLSNIDLKESEKELIKNDLNDLLKYMEILENVDTEGIEEMVSPIKINNSILRQDQVKTFENIEDIIKNFPERKDNLLRIPGIHI